MKRGWVLNLDAEHELAHPKGGSDPFSAVERRPQLLSSLRTLVGSDHVLSRGERIARDTSSPTVGCAWCPTPSARAALTRAGLEAPDAPSIDVLRRVNHRAFSAALGPTVEGSRFVTTRGDALAHVASASPTGAWLLKRPFGFAGRGRAITPPLTDATGTFIERTVADEGGLQIEPLLEPVLDLAIHGYVDNRGGVTLGEPTVQVVTAHGAWCSTRLATSEDLTHFEDEALRAEATLVSAALTEAGYFGPFGIDAFRYSVGPLMKLHSRCDLNARYTMGWAVGMHDKRPDRL